MRSRAKRFPVCLVAAAMMVPASCAPSSETVKATAPASMSLPEALDASRPYHVEMVITGEGVTVLALSERKTSLAYCDAEAQCRPIAAPTWHGKPLSPIALAEGRPDPVMITAYCDEDSDECPSNMTFAAYRIANSSAEQVMTFESDLLGAPEHLRSDAVVVDDTHVAMMIGGLHGRSALLQLDLEKKAVSSEVAIPGEYRALTPAGNRQLLVAADGAATAPEVGVHPMESETGKDTVAPNPGFDRGKVFVVSEDGSIVHESDAPDGSVLRTDDGRLLTVTTAGAVVDNATGERAGSVEVDRSPERNRGSQYPLSSCNFRLLQSMSYDQESNVESFWMASQSEGRADSDLMEISGVASNFEACRVGDRLFVVMSKHDKAGLEEKDSYFGLEVRSR